MNIIRSILFLLISFNGSAQDSLDVSESSNSEFLRDYSALVDALNMTDSIEVRFHEIYKEYGVTMKEAYENRTTWSGLNHTYQWAKNERDSKMKVILTEDQFYFFKKQQAIIESNARKRKTEEKRREEASEN